MLGSYRLFFELTHKRRNQLPRTHRQVASRASKQLVAAVMFWFAGPLLAQTAAQAAAQPPAVSATVNPSKSATASALTWSKCRVKGFDHEVRCGKLKRLLNPSDPQGPTIDIHVAVVEAVARNKLSDPVFFFAGGPGQSAIELAAAMFNGPLARLSNRRDLVFVDQRGTGKSAPLRCDKPNDKAPLAQQLDPAHQRERLVQCVKSLQSKPESDLRFFATPYAMADVDAVREAMGAARINVVGGSYGTRAALEYLRQFPGRVRSAVLDGLVPPDMALPASSGSDAQDALDKVFAACEAHAPCVARFPQLQARWKQLLAKPAQTHRLAHPATGVQEVVTIGREQLLMAVRPPLYAPIYASALPQAIHDATLGRMDTLVALSSALTSGAQRHMRMAEGMHFALVCNEDWPRVAQAAKPADKVGNEPRAEDFGGTLAQIYDGVCDAVPKSPLPAAFYEIKPSPASALLLSGGDDPVTPSRHGQRVAQALGPKATHVVVNHAGHGVMSLPCMRHAIYRFIDGAEDESKTRPDFQCASSMPRPTPFMALRTGQP
jgi:pimeloyl-ACP methyl ester carboxylesterase